MHPTTTPPTFSKLHTHLLTNPPPLLPPSTPTSKPLTPQISSLLLHPTLEAALHILNNDLPSAHFLVRHMQAAPALEGMFLHGILHRIEGDYDNARAWYKNVRDSEVFRAVWGSEGEAVGFIGEVERLAKEKVGDREQLGKESLREIEGVIEFCKRKFGEGELLDAREAWAQPEEGEHKKLGQDMVTGGKGFRHF